MRVKFSWHPAKERGMNSRLAVCGAGSYYAHVTLKVLDNPQILPPIRDNHAREP